MADLHSIIQGFLRQTDDAPKSTLPDIMRRGTPSRVMAPADPTLGHLARTPRRYPRDPMTMADAEAGLQAFPRQMRGNVRPYPPEHPAAYSDPVAFANQELAAPALADVLVTNIGPVWTNPVTGGGPNPTRGAPPADAPASSAAGFAGRPRASIFGGGPDNIRARAAIEAARRESAMRLRQEMDALPRPGNPAIAGLWGRR